MTLMRFFCRSFLADAPLVALPNESHRLKRPKQRRPRVKRPQFLILVGRRVLPADRPKSDPAGLEQWSRLFGR